MPSRTPAEPGTCKLVQRNTLGWTLHAAHGGAAAPGLYGGALQSCSSLECVHRGRLAYLGLRGRHNGDHVLKHVAAVDTAVDVVQRLEARGGDDAASHRCDRLLHLCVPRLAVRIMEPASESSALAAIRTQNALSGCCVNHCLLLPGTLEDMYTTTEADYMAGWLGPLIRAPTCPLAAALTYRLTDSEPQETQQRGLDQWPVRQNFWSIACTA